MWRGDTVAVTGRAEPEQVVSPLDVTEGVLPESWAFSRLLGRSFVAGQDDTPGSPRR